MAKNPIPINVAISKARSTRTELNRRLLEESYKDASIINKEGENTKMKAPLIPAKFLIQFENNLILHEYDKEKLKLCTLGLHEYLVKFSATKDYGAVGKIIDPYFRVTFIEITVRNKYSLTKRNWKSYKRTMDSGGRLVASGEGENSEEVINSIRDIYNVRYGTERDKIIYETLSSSKVLIKDNMLVQEVGLERVKFFTTGFFVYVFYPESRVMKAIESKGL